MLYLPLNPLSVNFLTLERAARKYALDMNAWLKLREMFPAPWLEVGYEDLVTDLSGQARRASIPGPAVGFGGAEVSRARPEQAGAVADLRRGDPTRSQPRHWALAPLCGLPRARAADTASIRESVRLCELSLDPGHHKLVRGTGFEPVTPTVSR